MNVSEALRAGVGFKPNYSRMFMVVSGNGDIIGTFDPVIIYTYCKIFNVTPQKPDNIEIVDLRSYFK